jgi:hypothetical protein
MHTRAVIASAGASSGFSAAALWEWITSPSTASAVAFVGSFASTAIGWYMARRGEINRARQAEADEIARAELARKNEARDDARRQEMLDALNAAAIGRLTARPRPLPPSSPEAIADRAVRLNVAWPPPETSG